MPIYEFACDACAEHFEEWMKITDSTVPPCPKCARPARRMISATSFALKGSGWYATDYKRSSGGASSSKET